MKGTSISREASELNDPWREPDKEITVAAWTEAVKAGETRSGYWEWVASEQERDKAEWAAAAQVPSEAWCHCGEADHPHLHCATHGVHGEAQCPGCERDAEWAAAEASACPKCHGNDCICPMEPTA